MIKNPNFLVVGAAKSGTTSIYYYLKQHPEIFLPDLKECRFFSNIKTSINNPITNKPHNVGIINNYDDYIKLFENITVEKVIGDVSPDYLYYYQSSIKNIKKNLGNEVKIIIILRNPIERAFSNYFHLVKENNFDLTFQETIERESEWINNNIWWGFHVIKGGFYYEAVKAYIDNFKNIKIFLFDDFKYDENNFVKSLYSFLDVDNAFKSTKPFFINKTGVPKSKIFDKILHNKIFSESIKLFFNVVNDQKMGEQVLRKLKEKNLVKPAMNIKTYNQLKHICSKDIQNLSSLINKDLSHWLVF